MKKLLPFIVVGVIAIPMFTWANGLGVYLGAGKSITQGLYHMDGSSADSSGNGNSGTDANVSYVATSTCQFGSKVAKYAVLSGDADTWLASTTFPWSTNTWTISFWFQFFVTTTNGNGSTLIGTTNPSVNLGFQVAPNINGANTLDLDVIGAGHNLIYPWTQDTKCHNLVVTATAGTMTMYLDGKQATSTSAFGGSMTTPSSRLGIGCTYQGIGCRVSSHATTTIDELIVANNTWTAQQVASYYSWAKGRFQTNNSQ